MERIGDPASAATGFTAALDTTHPSILLFRRQNPFLVVFCFIYHNRGESRKFPGECGRAMSGWRFSEPNLPSQVLEKPAARSVISPYLCISYLKARLAYLNVCILSSDNGHLGLLCGCRINGLSATTTTMLVLHGHSKDRNASRTYTCRRSVPLLQSRRLPRTDVPCT